MVTSWLNFWKSIGKKNPLPCSLDARVRPHRSPLRPLSFFLSPNKRQSAPTSRARRPVHSFTGNLVNFVRWRLSHHCSFKVTTFTQSLPAFYYLFLFSTPPSLFPSLCVLRAKNLHFWRQCGGEVACVCVCVCCPTVCVCTRAPVFSRAPVRLPQGSTFSVCCFSGSGLTGRGRLSPSACLAAPQRIT